MNTTGLIILVCIVLIIVCTKRLRITEVKILCCLALETKGSLFLEELIAEVNGPNQEGKDHFFKYSQNVILEAMGELIKNKQVFTNKHIHPVTQTWTIKYNIVKVKPGNLDQDY